jgi:hypothetical protein
MISSFAAVETQMQFSHSNNHQQADTTSIIINNKNIITSGNSIGICSSNNSTSSSSSLSSASSECSTSPPIGSSSPTPSSTPISAKASKLSTPDGYYITTTNNSMKLTNSYNNNHHHHHHHQTNFNNTNSNSHRFHPYNSYNSNVFNEKSHHQSVDTTQQQQQQQQQQHHQNFSTINLNQEPSSLIQEQYQYADLVSANNPSKLQYPSEYQQVTNTIDSQSYLLKQTSSQLPLGPPPPPPYQIQINNRFYQQQQQHQQQQFHSQSQHFGDQNMNKCNYLDQQQFYNYQFSHNTDQYQHYHQQQQQQHNPSFDTSFTNTNSNYNYDPSNVNSYNENNENIYGSNFNNKKRQHSGGFDTNPTVMIEDNTNQIQMLDTNCYTDSTLLQQQANNNKSLISIGGQFINSVSPSSMSSSSPSSVSLISNGNISSASTTTFKPFLTSTSCIIEEDPQQQQQQQHQSRLTAFNLSRGNCSNKKLKSDPKKRKSDNFINEKSKGVNAMKQNNKFSKKSKIKLENESIECEDGISMGSNDDQQIIEFDSNGEPKPKRTTANKKERRRTQSINKAFEDLRNRIPHVPTDTKLSKIKTLKLATDYIKHLMEGLERNDPNILTGNSFKPDLGKLRRECRSKEIKVNINQFKFRILLF